MTPLPGQLDLFDGGYGTATIARHSDPATSHEAAVYIAAQLNELQARFVIAVRTLLAPTAAEAAQWCADRWGGMAESYRKRAKEAVRAGALRECEPRKCSVSGRNATVYCIQGATP